MKPETPLPWDEIPNNEGHPFSDVVWIKAKDAEFAVHAVNAYPELVDCMKTFIEHDSYNPSAIAAEILLKELGEL